MKFNGLHIFFIPVMGTGFTIDTPIKVAKYGISSVISLVDDVLIEKVRKFYSEKYGYEYVEIPSSDIDHRAKRIEKYLNLVDDIVKMETEKLREAPFEPGSEITRYFMLLPEESPFKEKYRRFLDCKDESLKTVLEAELRKAVVSGDIDVNIMTKLDKDNFSKGEILPQEYSDALSALRGFAKSKLNASMVFSAGLNKRLYTYISEFKDFYPDENGNIAKRVTIKVSDYRSAVAQGRLLARKGVWVSEFRVESGLNCGGHAFASQGFLMGPVLEEFKRKRVELTEIMNKAYSRAVGDGNTSSELNFAVTVQGGITKSSESKFLRDYYKVDATGWGTPFLLVPEATSVDSKTLEKLANATSAESYMSGSSPLNVIFQNIKTSASEIKKRFKIKTGEYGSSCPKGYLAFNTEFTKRPICTASAKYQKLKIEELKSSSLSQAEIDDEIERVLDKACICHELGGGWLIENGVSTEDEIATAVCPGPIIAYFSKITSLSDMVDHIYGRLNILDGLKVPSLFSKELELYVEHFAERISSVKLSEKEVEYLRTFHDNLLSGIEYYQTTLVGIFEEAGMSAAEFKHDIKELFHRLSDVVANSKKFSLAESLSGI